MITVISSFFNESKNCELFLQKIEECSKVIKISEIVLVDNGSTDDTFSKLKKFKSDKFSIKIIQNPANSGYGDGFHKAFINSTNNYIFTLHSDLQFDLNDYLSKNIKTINYCISKNINIFPKRANRSFLSSIKSYILRLVIGLINFNYFNDFNGQPKLLIKKDFSELKKHCSGFGYDLTVYFYLKKKRKKLNTNTFTFEKKRVYGEASWNKSLYSSIKMFFKILKELNHFKKINF